MSRKFVPRLVGFLMNKRPTRQTSNRDRVVALRRNRDEATRHAKDMTMRMGVSAPAAGASGPDAERLHVRIAHAGVCSRRAAEQLILEGRVEVNGQIVASLGYKVNPDDEVRVDGQPIRTVKAYTVVLNKPTGVVTTMLDPQGRRTIRELLPD